MRFLTELQKVGSRTCLLLVAGLLRTGVLARTFQLCGDTVSSDAVSGALLSGQFTYTIGITQACQPVSPVHRVTKAHNNLILELEGRPAFEVFAERVSPQLREDLRRAAAYIFVGLPGRRRTPAYCPRRIRRAESRGL